MNRRELLAAAGLAPLVASLPKVPYLRCECADCRNARPGARRLAEAIDRDILRQVCEDLASFKNRSDGELRRTFARGSSGLVHIGLQYG